MKQILLCLFFIINVISHNITYVETDIVVPFDKFNLHCNLNFAFVKFENYKLTKFHINANDTFIYKNLWDEIFENQVGRVPCIINNEIFLFDYENSFVVKSNGKLEQKWIKLIGEVNIENGNVQFEICEIFDTIRELRKNYILNKFQKIE